MKLPADARPGAEAAVRQTLNAHEILAVQCRPARNDQPAAGRELLGWRITFGLIHATLLFEGGIHVRNVRNCEQEMYDPVGATQVAPDRCMA